MKKHYTTQNTGPKPIDWKKVYDKYITQQNRIYAQKFIENLNHPRIASFKLKENFLEISFRYRQESILIYYDDGNFRQELDNVLSDLQKQD